MENEDINLMPAPKIPEPLRKKKIILVAVLIIIAMIIGAVLYYIFLQQRVNLQNKYNNLVKQQKSSGQNAGSQKIDDARLFVFIQSRDKSTEKQLFTISSDFYSSNVSGIEDQIEYQNNSLYIIRKMSDSGIDELWRFGKRDQFGKALPGTKLYIGDNLAFNVSQSGKYIAVTSSDNKKLLIIDADGNLIKEYNSADLGFFDDQGAPFDFHLLDWSTDENEFWGTLGNKPLSGAIYKISVGDWEIKKYYAPLNQEWDFNADNKKIVYSDCPVGKDAASSDIFRDSETKVSLQIYDVESERNDTIDSIISKCFDPKWLNKKVIEYNNPNSDDRISKIID